MDAPVGYAGGGIVGLDQLISQVEIESALAYDLMQIGKSIHTIGTPEFSWVELRAFLLHAPAGSAIRRSQDKMAAYTSPEMQLATIAIDALLGANWQRGGGKGPRPEGILTLIERQMKADEALRTAPQNRQELTDVRKRLAAKRAAIRGDN